jgi:hypothetical protein
MRDDIVPDDGPLVKRLAFSAEQLLHITLMERRFYAALADSGCIGRARPKVYAGDSGVVVRIKEAILQSSRKRDRITSEMATVGAVLYDSETMEILLPGAPETDGWRSWMPGEATIAWWRAAKDRDSERRPLPGLHTRDIGPNHH